MGDQEQLGESVATTLKVRGIEYGAAWKLTGKVLKEVTKIGRLPILSTPYFFNWIMILNKLHRALMSPENKDHWEDIAGYALLVVKDIDDETS
jgi:hypothetical protein